MLAPKRSFAGSRPRLRTLCEDTLATLVVAVPPACSPPSVPTSAIGTRHQWRMLEVTSLLNLFQLPSLAGPTCASITTTCRSCSPRHHCSLCTPLLPHSPLPAAVPTVASTTLLAAPVLPLVAATVHTCSSTLGWLLSSSHRTTLLAAVHPLVTHCSSTLGRLLSSCHRTSMVFHIRGRQHRSPPPPYQFCSHAGHGS